MLTKKNVLIIIGILIMLLGIYAFSPLLYDSRVNESLGDINLEKIQPMELQQKSVQPTGDNPANVVATISQGEFAGVAGHSGKGTAKLLKSGENYFVRLEDNFEATNGPDLYVYLGKDNKYDPDAEIGKLKGNVGGQNYEIPENINPSQYNEVWIWCKAFAVEFAKAELK